MKAGTPEPARARVLVVDDHAFFREGIGAWLERQEGLACAGFADTVAAAREAVGRLSPDLMLLDLTLRDGDGFDVLKALAAAGESRVKTIVFSRRDELFFAERALRLGARGYVMKDEPVETVLAAIRTVLRGQWFMTPRLSRRLLERAGNLRIGAIEQLGPRELEVFELLGQGWTSKAIAARLGLSVKTIDSYRETLKQKLGLPDAVALIQHATLWVQRDRSPEVGD